MNQHLETGSPTQASVTRPTLLDKLEREGEEKNLIAEIVAAEAKEACLFDLNAKAFRFILRGQEANIELGRVFNQIKALVGHGNWRAYYEATFAPAGVAFRTAQEYMRLANEADAIQKNANSALFPPATDPQAVAVNAASEQAKQDVARATAVAAATAPTVAKPARKTRKSRLRLNGSYNLPLFLTGEQKDNLDELRKSQNWRGAELAIIATIERLFVQYGLVNPPEPSEFRPTGVLQTAPDEPDEPFVASDDCLPSELFAENGTEKEAEYENALA
jgi:hypothetical protein